MGSLSLILGVDEKASGNINWQKKPTSTSQNLEVTLTATGHVVHHSQVYKTHSYKAEVVFSPESFLWGHT